MERTSFLWLIAFLLLLFFLRPVWTNQSKVIVVSMDGFRHDYLDMAKAQGRNISAFEDLYNRGFRARVKPVMPTITFPTHFATATGRYVEHHGIVNNQFYDPQLNESFSYKNSEDGRDPKWWNYNGDEPLWMTNERNGHKSCVYYWPGSASSYNGKVPTKNKLVYNSSVPFKARIDEIIQWMREDDDMTLCMLYMKEPDYSGHMHGPDSKEVMDSVEELNDVIDHLVKSVNSTPNLRDSVNIILTADHGMAYVPEENVIHLYKILDPEAYIPNPSRVFLGIWPKPGGPSVQDMYTKLLEANITGATVYLKEDLPFHYRYANSTRTPPLMVIATIGYAISHEPPRYHSKGDHGYDNADKRMHASLVAAGPRLQSLEEIQELQQVDIYPLVCGLLNLTKPNKIDGNLRRIVGYINPPPSEKFIADYLFYSAGGLIEDSPDAAGRISLSILCYVVILFCLWKQYVIL